MSEPMTTADLNWYRAKVTAAEYALAWQFLEVPKAVQDYQQDVSALIREIERLDELLADSTRPEGWQERREG